MSKRSLLTKIVNGVNCILDFFMDPCDAPFTVYVETLFPAVMDLLVDLYAFDVEEYQQQKPFSEISPKAEKSKSKIGRGKKGGGKKKWSKIFEALSGDPGELLGKKRARHFGGSRRILTGGTSHLWIIGGVVQRAAFWVWIVCRSGEFFYDWWNGIVAKGYCTERGTGVLLAYEGVDTTHALFGWAPVFIPTILKQRGDVAWNVSSGYCVRYALNVNYRCQLEPANANDGSIVRCRATVWRGEEEADAAFTQRIIKKGATQQIEIDFVCPPGWSFTIEFWNSDGLVYLKDEWLHCVSSKRAAFDALLHWPRDERGERRDAI